MISLSLKFHHKRKRQRIKRAPKEEIRQKKPEDKFHLMRMREILKELVKRRKSIPSRLNKQKTKKRRKMETDLSLAIRASPGKI